MKGIIGSKLDVNDLECPKFLAAVFRAKDMPDFERDRSQSRTHSRTSSQLGIRARGGKAQAVMMRHKRLIQSSRFLE